MPTAVAAIADVPLPYRTPFAVRVVAPVPPLPTDKAVVSVKLFAEIAPLAVIPVSDNEPPAPVVPPVPTCRLPKEGLVMLALPAKFVLARTNVPELVPAVPSPKFKVAAAERERPTSEFHASTEPAVRETDVNAPVVGVVAPTVPLILIEAVPVRLVTVPLDGVPRAPPLTINDPAVPTLTPRAVTTPVPVVTVAGASPAPPPTTIALAASAADVAHVVPLEK